MNNFKIFVPLKDISRIPYRGDINFLRAIAVFSVVIYHSEINLFNAGFLGVDLFFVISGYLISNIIISDLNSNQFKFKNFYIRRIKRIVPALLSVLVFTTPFAYYLLPPNEYISYAKSVFASLFFYSNLYFNNLDFYNSSGAELMPLLHTWSLAVEEQFYILFPLFLFLIFKINKKILLKSLILILIISFFTNQTELDDKFYLTQYRGWELLLGSLAGFIPRFNTNKFFTYFAYFLIFFPICFFDDNWLLDIEPKIILTAGVFFILVSNDSSSIFIKMNDNKIIKNIGKASYSIYLFHQPVYSFFKWFLYKYQIKFLISIFFDSLILLIFIFGISYLNYKYIEKYFIKLEANKKVLSLLPVLFLVIGFNALTIKNNGFFTQRYNMPEKVILFYDADNYSTYQNGQNCHHSKSNNSKDICIFNNENNKKAVYIFGDSHAKLISSHIVSNVSTNPLYLVTGDSCIFLIKTNVPDCARKDKEAINMLAPKIQDSIIVYIANTWDKFDNIYYEGLELEKTIPETVKFFLNNNNKVIVVYQIPHLYVNGIPFDVLDQYFSRNIEFGDPVIMESNLYYESPNTVRSHKIYNDIVDNDMYRVFTSDIICNEILAGYCVGAIGNQIYYEDNNHLTIEGSELVGNRIIEIIKSINNE